MRSSVINSHLNQTMSTEHEDRESLRFCSLPGSPSETCLRSTSGAIGEYSRSQVETRLSNVSHLPELSYSQPVQGGLSGTVDESSCPIGGAGAVERQRSNERLSTQCKVNVFRCNKASIQPKPQPQQSYRHEFVDDSVPTTFSFGLQSIRTSPPPMMIPMRGRRSLTETMTLFMQSSPCRQILNEYAEREYTTELLNFWNHAMEYREMLKLRAPSKCIAHEELMFNLYGHEDSYQCLNLPCDLRNRLKLQPHSQDVWFEVQEEVAMLIRNGPYLHMALAVSSTIRNSWKQILGRISASEAGEIFYKALFERQPSVRSLFKSDISKQGEMLTSVFSKSAEVLVVPEKLIDIVVDLGERHRSYGISLEHFSSLGEALLEMLHTVLDEDFDDETRRSWIIVYELIGSLMLMTISPEYQNKFLSQRKTILNTSTPNTNTPMEKLNRKPLPSHFVQWLVALLTILLVIVVLVYVNWP